MLTLEQKKRARKILSTELARRPPEEVAKARELAVARRKFDTYFLDEGPYRRDLYQKQLEFFKAGAQYRERLFCAGNKTGKTQGLAYELTAHLTGHYPAWWEGRRFDDPVEAWACNVSWNDTRDINQAELIGPPSQRSLWGIGMIPHAATADISRNPHVKDGISTVLVKHVSGGLSELQFKSYEQGRESFQGRNKHVIWPDEECPESVYGEMLLRTMTVNGLIMMSYTPIHGLTRLTVGFLPGGKVDSDA